MKGRYGAIYLACVLSEGSGAQFAPAKLFQYILANEIPGAWMAAPVVRGNVNLVS